MFFSFQNVIHVWNMITYLPSVSLTPPHISSTYPISTSCNFFNDPHSPLSASHLYGAIGWSMGNLTIATSSIKKKNDYSSHSNFYCQSILSVGWGLEIPSMPRFWLAQLFYRSYVDNHSYCELLFMRLIALSCPEDSISQHDSPPFSS